MMNYLRQEKNFRDHEAALRPSTTQTYCPYTGDASCYSVAGPDGEITDAVWTYTAPRTPATLSS